MLGNIGSSREVTFYADGDGDYRPKFDWMAKDLPKPDEGVKRTYGDFFFDAG